MAVRDVEASSLLSAPASSRTVRRDRGGGGRTEPPDNPYADLPPPLPRWHPLAFLPRLAWMLGSTYFMHQMDVYRTIMTSPSVSHTWFKVGLGASVTLMFLKAYVELYVGKLHNQTISYRTMPRSTHASIGLLLLAGSCFQVALWPAYGVGKSIVIIVLLVTFLINFCLMFPTVVQNMIAIVLLTFFLQEYQ